MPQNENGKNIKNEILAFYNSLAKDRNHRYRSWEHCYGYFRQHASFDHDIASLHLAFYLASWGMYRGSTALLWKDYQVHRPAIEKLLDAKYSALWDLDICDSDRDDATAKAIVSLADEIKAIYQEQITSVNGTPKLDHDPSGDFDHQNTSWHTWMYLACDHFFVKGFREPKERKYSRFHEAFLRNVFQFYREHKSTFLETQKAIKKAGGIDYPPMKLVDMYFWKLDRNRSPKSVDK